MSVARALLVGVDAGFRADIVAVAAALTRLGVVDVTQLLGPQASKSAIESRVRKLAAATQPGDVVWFVYAGSAFASGVEGYLECADTLDDDRRATSLALADIYRALTASGAKLRFLLDATGVPDDEPLHLFPAHEDNILLVAAGFGEPSQAAGGHRLWLQRVADALGGKVPEALADGELSADSLQAWLMEELPRVIRKAIAQPLPQTPRIYGSPGVILARVAAAMAESPRLNLKQLKRIVFRGEKRDAVKNLAGFAKGFKLPEAATPSSQKWMHRLAADDLRAQIEETYNTLREHLGFKRKDLETTLAGEGVGFIRTPKFDYTLSVALDADDPTSVIWRREVSQIKNVDVLRTEAFQRVFAGTLDTLEFEFEKPIDVEALIDRIEDEPPPGVKVRVASDASTCDIAVQGFGGRIHVERSLLRVEGGVGLTPDSLVAQFFAFLVQFGGKKGLPAVKG